MSRLSSAVTRAMTAERKAIRALIGDRITFYARKHGLSDAEIRALVPEFAASADVVGNWRAGVSEIPLRALPRLSEALGMGGTRKGEGDPTFLLAEIGLLDKTATGDLAAIAWNVQRLALRERELEDRVRRRDRSAAITDLVHVARASGRWAVAIWPVTVGPREHPMHVEDRIDLRRTDDAFITDVEVFRDPTWTDALRRAHASPSGLGHRWQSSKDRRVSRWVASHAETPTLPRVRRPHPSPAAPSICIYGITIDSGANEVAMLLSIALGYGFAPTRDEAMEQMGMGSPLNATEGPPRARAHARHLREPPPAIVWSHHAPPYADANPDPFDVADLAVPVVWLEESKALRQQYADRWTTVEPAWLDDIAEHVRRRARLHDVEAVPVDVAPDENARWMQYLEIVARLVTEFHGIAAAYVAGAAAREQAKLRDRDVAAPFLGWLEERLSRGTAT